MEDLDYWEKRANKSEWIHDKYVDVYGPYSGKRLSNKDVQYLKTEFSKIDKEADKLFGKL